MLGSVCLKTKWGWDRIIAGLGLCALFFLATYSLYRIVPREYRSSVTAGSDSVAEPVLVEREMIQTVPVDSPITGLTLFFPDTGAERAGDIKVNIVGEKSRQVYFDGAVSLTEKSERGEAVLPFSHTAVAGQDSHLVVTVTPESSAGVTVLCLRDQAVFDGVLTVDGVLAEGSLTYQTTQLREYWTWRRTVPPLYGVLCLLLIRLAFLGKAWYEKKSGKAVSFFRDEMWWRQTVCCGFLLISAVFFARNAAYFGVAWTNPEFFCQTRLISLFSHGVMALMYMAVTGLISYIALASPPLERAAAVSVLVIGLFYMIAITPLSPPDEAHHYQSTYQLSNYLLFQWDDPEMGYSAHFDYRGLSRHENVPGGYLRMITEWSMSGGQGERVTIPTPRKLSYPIEYLPQVIGLTVGRLLNLNFLGIFYLGRLTNLIFFAASVYFAVKRIPRFKALMALIAILPMTLHQAASYSYDAFINAMALLFVSALIREYNGEGKMNWKDFLWLLIPGALLAPAKAVYGVMLLLALLIPPQRFGGRKQKWGAIAAAALLCGGMLVAANFSSLQYRVQSAAKDAVEVDAQAGGQLYTVGFILEHPMETARIFLNTLKDQGIVWLMCGIGWYLSGLSLDISIVYVGWFAALLLLSVLACGQGAPKVTLGQRASFVICSGLVVLLAMLGMFTGWTVMGSPVVEGIQGRYFIPILPLLLLAVSGNWEAKWSQHENGIFAGGCVAHTLVILQIFSITIH